MKSYVALLRGINVGGNKKVNMSTLAEMFRSMGFQDVSTYINSGNVMFKSEKNDFKSDIEKMLLKTFGFEISVLIRDKESIQRVCDEVPSDWVNNSDQKTDCIFLWDEFNKPDTVNLITQNSEVDTLKYIDGCIVWNINKSQYNLSGMHKFIGTKVYKNMTARNINTVRKIRDLMQ